MMLLGLRLHARPEGETALFKVTVPVKPLLGATVIVELAEAPAFTVAEAGLAVTVKGMVTI